jgi:hypothetical protein
MRPRVLLVIALPLLLAAVGCTNVEWIVEKPPTPTWDEYLAELNARGVDVVLVFDSSGSMGGRIIEVKDRMRRLMTVVATLIPHARIGLVAYRDTKEHDPDEYQYVIKFVPLTLGDRDGLNRLDLFLKTTEVYGGGDIPEAVFEGLEKAIESAGWRKGSRKVMIVIGDCPPHAEDHGLGKIYALCKDWHRRTGGTVSCLYADSDGKLLPEFRQMAALGGGEAAGLQPGEGEKDIKWLAACVFGPEWKRKAAEACGPMVKDIEY